MNKTAQDEPLNAADGPSLTHYSGRFCGAFFFALFAFLIAIRMNHTCAHETDLLCIKPGTLNIPLLAVLAGAWGGWVKGREIAHSNYRYAMLNGVFGMLLSYSFFALFLAGFWTFELIVDNFGFQQIGWQIGLYISGMGAYYMTVALHGLILVPVLAPAGIIAGVIVRWWSRAVNS